MSRRPMAAWIVAVVALLTAMAAVFVIFVLPLDSPEAAPTPTASPTPTFAPASPVLSALQVSPPSPNAPELAAVLESKLSVSTLGEHVGIAVFDVESQTQVYGLRADSGFIPASTAKLLTATAALESLGPDHRFTTRVVQGGTPEEIVLVGGGDPLLTAAAADPDTPDEQLVPHPSRLATLATATADDLRVRGIATVRVGVDDSLFPGPAISPHWPSSYVRSGVVGPVSALSLDGGREKPDRDSRVSDPALHAGAVFARELEAAGIEVVGSPTRVSAQPGTAEVASLESTTLEAIVEWILATSDNDGAEILGRQVALNEGHPASFDGGTTAIIEVLSRLGVDLSDAKLRDASGLSRDTRLAPADLAAVLVAAADPGNGRLRATITGLPVAGFSGSLTGRFEREAASEGQGIVRAKTGTLTGVSALAGIVPSADGMTYAFAVVADRVSGSTDAARRSLDRVSAELAACGCALPTAAVAPTPDSTGQSVAPAPDEPTG